MFKGLQRNLNRPVRCPRCKSDDVILNEHSVNSILKMKQVSTPTGYTLERMDIRKRTIDSSVEGNCCTCGHTWKVRGIEHISELKFASHRRKSKELE